MPLTIIYRRLSYDGLAAALVVYRWYTALLGLECPLRVGDEAPFTEENAHAFAPLSAAEKAAVPDVLLLPVGRRAGFSRGAVVDGRDVVLLGTTFPRRTMDALHRTAATMRVIDYHIKEGHAFAELPYTVGGKGESTATLAWATYFPGEPLPVFLRYVRARVLSAWDEDESWDEADARDFMAAMQTVPMTLAAYNTLLHNEALHAHLIAAGAAMRRANAQRCRRAIERVVVYTDRATSIKVGFLNTDDQISDVGHALARGEEAVADVAVVYYANHAFASKIARGGGVALRVVVRSAGVDAGALARWYGGRGGEGAAGFRFDGTPDALVEGVMRFFELHYANLCGEGSE